MAGVVEVFGSMKIHGDPMDSISHEVDGWIASDGHRRNLLGPFNVCGIGRTDTASLVPALSCRLCPR